MGASGRIELDSGLNFEQALCGLEEFTHIWVLFSFHLNAHWKPMVRPPGLTCKKGVFATRAPHRPSRIGMSVLQLSRICGRTLFVTGSDLLDETPILDIKPYIPSVDIHPNASAGWTVMLAENPKKNVVLSKSARETLKKVDIPLDVILNRRTKRIIRTTPSGFILAYKTFRLEIEEGEDSFLVISVFQAQSLEKSGL